MAAQKDYEMTSASQHYHLRYEHLMRALPCLWLTMKLNEI